MTTKIIGTGSYAPETIIKNDDLAEFMETSDQWISSRTGIRERRIVNQESTCMLAVKAAEKALESAGIKAEDLDLIILATSSADYCFPSGACQVQGEIGAVNAVAFDLSAACTGFVFALNTVHSFFQSGIYKTALVIGAEVFSKLTDWEDRSTCVLFGDGAGAVVLQASDRGLIHMIMGSDGSKSQVLSCVNRTNGNFLTKSLPEIGYTYMDGQEVFKFAVKKVPECIKQLLEQSKTDLSEIQYFILHQANVRIVESIAKRLSVPIEKFPVNLDRFGNTSAASIPILLDEVSGQGTLKRGDKLIIAGFGAGLTWGATLMEW